MRNEESGQDLAEYCLLTALLTLLVAAIFVQASGGVQAIWNDAGTSLHASHAAAAVTTTTTTTTAPASK
ncbi:MAG: hypothetical protein KGN36_12230 [Acidobacteriota bacterium]|nr:hypothetical protein [Acidobacteriota bacterium]